MNATDDTILLGAVRYCVYDLDGFLFPEIFLDWEKDADEMNYEELVAYLKTYKEHLLGLKKEEVLPENKYRYYDKMIRLAEALSVWDVPALQEITAHEWHWTKIGLTETHMGDCTKQCFTCMRCLSERMVYGKVITQPER